MQAKPNMMRKDWRCALMLCMALLAPHARGAGRLDDPALAARVNGAPLQAFSLNVMLRLARLREPDTTQANVLDAMIAERLLAQWARRNFKDEQLHDRERVGVSRDVDLDNQLVSNFRVLYPREIEAALHAIPGGTLNGALTAQPQYKAARLDQVLGDAGKMQMDYTLNAGQIARAKMLVLARFSLRAGQGGAITLFDVYQRQNVQGRIALFDRDRDFIGQQVQAKLAALFVLDWATRTFGGAAIDDLRRVLADRNEVRATMTLYGMAADSEAENVLLAQLARQVKPAEIRAYYQAHKDQFTRIERVRARHIRVDSEEQGTAVVAAAARGENFSALARRFSTAPDRRSGGDLGWIASAGDPGWLASLAFIQQEGKVSEPFRSPGASGPAGPWEIILVEKRIEGYQPADSETVRHIAGNAIAHAKAANQFKAVRASLLQGAAIEINPRPLAAPSHAAGATP